MIDGLRADPARLAALGAARPDAAGELHRGGRSSTSSSAVARMAGHAVAATSSLVGTVTAVLPTAAPRAPLDLSRPLRLHVVGVGGPGMSAIAIALAEMGHTVSGSDLRDQPVLDRVRAAGVDVHVGHDRRRSSSAATR